MTEHEILQNYYACSDMMATYAMNFISILSGYLLATYFLGSKLAGIQFIILTLSYIFVMCVTIFAFSLRVQESFYLVSKLESFESSAVYVSDPTATVFIFTAHVLILIGSIYFGFMSVRKQ